MSISRKRLNPYAGEHVSESKSIRFDDDAIKAKTWSILMNPVIRKTLKSPTKHVTTTSAADEPPLDYVDELKKDLTYATCAGCRQATLETNKCCFCHRACCDRCSAQCEVCLYHFCAVCRTTNYDSHSERIFCLTCNEEHSQHQSYDFDEGNSMDIS